MQQPQQNQSEEKSSPKDIRFDLDALEAIREGVDRVADTVKSTLGPAGNNVVIEQTGPMQNNLITKDGVTVARMLEFDDERFVHMGAEIVKQASKETSTNTGDGTTTSTVLAQAILDEAIKRVASGVPTMDLERGLKKALRHTRAFISERAFGVETRERVEEVATVSANGDAELGEIIAEATEQVGKDGIITVDQGKGSKTTLELTEGVEIERGWVAEDFADIKNVSELSFDDPYVLAVDDDIGDPKRLMPAFQHAEQNNRPLVVVAHDVTGDALAMMLQNFERGVLDCVAITAPRITDKRRELLNDVAVLGGGEVVSEETGVGFDTHPPDAVLGTFSSVTVRPDNTTFLGGDGDDEAVKNRVRNLRSRAQTAGSEYDTEFMQKRISQLSGGMAVIRVGGNNEMEMKHRKALIEDALNATQASLRGGIVAGGGYLLVRASMYLGKVQEAGDVDFESDSEEWGWNILKNTLDAPARQIIRNAGDEPPVVLDEIRNYFRAEMGYDVRDREYKDFYEEGIIDPAIVIEDAVSNAVSSVTSLIRAGGAVAKKS